MVFYFKNKVARVGLGRGRNVGRRSVRRKKRRTQVPVSAFSRAGLLPASL